jgi:hypothetical protein
MADRQLFHVDIDLDLNQLKNAVIHQLATDPGSPVQGQIWYNSTTDELKYYDGAAVQIIANKAWVIAEINKLERIQGQFDASPGLLPTAANKIQGDLTQIVAGDYWIISVAGTIAGIGGDDVLSIGDKLQYVGGGAGTAANWVGIQTNLNDSNIGNVKSEKQTVNLVANTALNVNAATIANIHSIQVYNSAGELIIVGIEKLGLGNQRTLTSKKSLTGVVVELTGAAL